MDATALRRALRGLRRLAGRGRLLGIAVRRLTLALALPRRILLPAEAARRRLVGRRRRLRHDNPSLTDRPDTLPLNPPLGPSASDI
ncbi:hypothetical protein GCM10027091_71560 [Streptomyces daliensis]